MTSQSMIIGTIEGVSKRDFNRLKQTLQSRFDEVGWSNDMLVVRSSRDHGQLKDVFTMIADTVKKGKFGSLLYVGHGNVACFYFGHKKYVGRKYKEPRPPGWWKPDKK